MQGLDARLQACAVAYYCLPSCAPLLASTFDNRSRTALFGNLMCVPPCRGCTTGCQLSRRVWMKTPSSLAARSAVRALLCMANAAAGGGETRMCSHMQWQPTRWVNTRPVSTWLAILCFVSHMGNHFAAAWCGRTCGVVHAKSAHHASMAFQGIASAIQAVRYAKPAMATLLLLAWNLGGSPGR